MQDENNSDNSENRNHGGGGDISTGADNNVNIPAQEHDVNRTRSSNNTPPPLSSEELPSQQAAEVLEEMIQEETLRHLEAAWAAQRRLARACFLAKKEQPKT